VFRSIAHARKPRAALNRAPLSRLLFAPLTVHYLVALSVPSALERDSKMARLNRLPAHSLAEDRAGNSPHKSPGRAPRFQKDISAVVFLLTNRLCRDRVPIFEVTLKPQMRRISAAILRASSFPKRGIASIPPSATCYPFSSEELMRIRRMMAEINRSRLQPETFASARRIRRST